MTKTKTPLKVPQQKKANGRYEGTNYRYSDKFISRVTGWLIAAMFILPAIGFGLGALGDTIFDYGDIPDWYTITAISLALGGIVVPLAVSAWLGATAINKYAGPVGLLFVFGICAVSAGDFTNNQALWVWIGIGSIVLSGLLFFYIGFQAKVPMWLQLPILNSPRLYVSKPDAKISKRTHKK